MTNNSSKFKKNLEIVNAISGWSIFFKKVKITDLLNERTKLNVARANPRDKSTHGKAISEITLSINNKLVG